MPEAEILFRCSSIGRLMTEPKTQKEGPLSVGARTYIRELAAQEIFGVDFEVSSKEMEKGIRCEPDSIALLNRVRGLQLVKNTERRSNGIITGECDLFHAQRRRGHDLKTSWSIASFPIALADCLDKLYEWQMHGYMWLWDADEWEVNYCLVNTPEELIRNEPLTLHFVDHIPERMRVTTWTVQRDAAKQEQIAEKVAHARRYFAEVVAEFESTHRQQLAGEPAAAPAANVHPMPTRAPSAPSTPPSLKLSDIQQYIAPFEIRADGMRHFGIEVAESKGAAKMYRQADLMRLLDAGIARLVQVRDDLKKAAA